MILFQNYLARTPDLDLIKELMSMEKLILLRRKRLDWKKNRELEERNMNKLKNNIYRLGLI